MRDREGREAFYIITVFLLLIYNIKSSNTFSNNPGVSEFTAVDKTAVSRGSKRGAVSEVTQVRRTVGR